MPKKSNEKLEEVIGEEQASADQPASESQEQDTKKPPELPTEATSTAADLEHKMVIVHGAPGIGKTTLASLWAGGNTFFLNTAGELGDLVVRQAPVQSWEDFRRWSWGISESANPPEATIVDTGDMLGKYCAEKVRRKLGIAHESDLEWGKGWSSLRDEFMVNVAKLAAIPNMGLVFVVHSDPKEVKTRSESYHKWQFRGVKGIRETLLDMADLVLFLDYKEDEEEIRVIRTKPSRYYDAKERGLSPRLPAEIDWPLGTNGWDLIKTEWDKNG